MDVFEYRTSRSLNTDGVFINTNPDSEMSGMFIRLKNLMVSEIHLQWDKAFLEQYIKEGMVPRGLRWDIHPQQDEPDLESWFKYFNETGLKLLQFLVDRKSVKLSLIDSEIKDLRDKLTPHKGTAEYISLSTNLKSILEREEKEQRNKKQKKYNRDFTDYTSNLVYGWQKKNLNTPPTNSDPSSGDTFVPVVAHQTRRLIYEPPQVQGHKHSGSNRPGPRPLPAQPPRDFPPPPLLPPTPRLRGGGGPRGRGRGQYNNPSVDSQYRQYPRGPPPNGNHGPNGQRSQYDPDYGYRTPVHTNNRFAPLYDNDSYGNFSDPYSHYDGDVDSYNRTPYYSNSNYSGPTQPLGFHRSVEGHPRNSEGKEGPEGGGGSKAKRKRT